MSSETGAAPGGASALAGDLAAPAAEAWARQLAGRLARVRAATWFVLLALPVGLFLVMAIPPSQGLDEPNHFLRVYGISEGTVVAIHSGGRVGAFVPTCAIAYVDGVLAHAHQPSPLRWSDFLREPAGCDPGATTFRPFENTAVYSPLSYWPQVTGVTAARLARLPLPAVFYAGRLAGLLAYVLVVGLALALAPVGRLAIAVVALLPMALISASVYSADGVTLALALLLVAAVLRSLRDDGAGLATFALAVCSATGLAVCKSTYVALAPLLLLVPGRLVAPGRGRWAAAVKVAIVVAIGLVAAAWFLQVRDVASVYETHGNDSARQLAFVLAHPLRFAVFLANTLLGATTPFYTWPGFISWVGYGRNMAAGTPAPPVAVIALGFGLLALAYVREGVAPAVRSAASALAAAWPLALVVVNAVLVVTALYLTDATVGTATYWGVHGRYFLPLAAVPVVSAVLVTSRREPRSALPFAAGSAVLLTYLVVKVLATFY